MSFTVTAMQAEHIAEIAKLEKECFSSPWSEAALAEELSNPDSHFLVAECGEVAGYIGVQEICGEAYITNIAVFESHRKKGIGKALLKAAADGAKERNCEFITLEVRVSNTPAIALYESEGFEKAGIRKNFYSDPTENGIIYTKYF
jgi:ribosomal-protein-alanine N-acetyltransferase